MKHTRSIIRKIPTRLASAVFIVAILVPTLATPSASSAASGDRALLVKQSTRYVAIQPGKSMTVSFDFRNAGSTTWTRSGSDPVGINTDSPMRRTSMLQYRWRASWRPARVSQAEVRPGEIGTFRFAIKAPNKPGIWIERFAVVRGTDTRIPGGEVELVVVIGKSVTKDDIFKAYPTQRELTLWVKPGQRILEPIQFKNIGYATLRTEGYGVAKLGAPATTLASSQAIRLATSNSINQKATRHGKTTVVLDAVAPSQPGTYTRTFSLYGIAGRMSRSDVKVTMIVSQAPTPPLKSEPIIRVGVFAPVLSKPIGITSTGPYEVRKADSNTLLSSRSAGQITNLSYNPTTGIYTVNSHTTHTTREAVRFIPKTDDSIMQIETTALGSYNRFRGTLELRYAAATGKLWTINELPLELYMRGLGETGPTAPSEFVKTLITAARSYALYKVVEGKRHDNENYKINSTTDQIYKGYNYELKTPNISAAVEATRGMIVAHPSMVSQANIAGAIVAAYSSCTDGRTRSYLERWGGDPDWFPYLVSVPDPLGICTDGGYPSSYMTGGGGNHMVGMSAYGALRTSQKPGMTYEAVLRYYYTGTSVIQAYP